MFQSHKSRSGRHSSETDPRRALGLKQACDLLVSCGYFRAKMPTLSPFDRVVGGLVWCITSSNVDVDVDILYEENSSIGDRIRVSEQVVRSLQLMKCPFLLQSFQIQGLDYDNIYPTLKWLIKQVLQTRQLTGNESRLISIRTFDHTVGSNNLIALESNLLSEEPAEILPIFPADKFVHSSLDATANFITLYTQQRKYKKRAGVVFDSVDQKVEATLLEYDDRHVRLAVDLEQQDIERTKREQQGRGSGGSRVATGTGAGALASGDREINELLASQQTLGGGGIDLSNIEGAELQKLQEANRLRQTLQGQFDTQQSGAFRVNAGLVGSLVTISDDVLKAQNAYHAQDQLQQEKVNFKDQKEIEQQRHQKQCDQLARKITDLQAQVEEKLQEAERVKAEYTTVNEKHEERLAKIKTVNEKLVELDKIEAQAENKEVLAELKRLVILNEQIKKQEIQFKQSCKEQMAKYRGDIDQLKALIGSEEEGAVTEEQQKFAELQNLIEKETNRLEKIRDLLYQRHLELLGVYHKIDEIPTRSELLQFEKRFSELYQITASKLIETRSYFTWYNTLSTTYSHLQQELTLLESILNNFSIGMKTDKSQLEMKNQMKQMLAVVEDNIDSTQSELQAEVDQETILVEKYNKLMKKERDYYKLLKQFQLECDTNAKLAQQVDSIVPAQ